jgi:plastocyanin
MILVIAGVAAAFAAASAFAFVGTSDAEKAAKTRTLYVSAVEWKGSASVAKEAYPGPVPAGGGYESCPPGSQECDLKGDTTKWAVETYRFDTAAVFAYAGERVVIKAFGVNAAEHPIAVPSLKKNFLIKRGVVTTADLGVVKNPGIYNIYCTLHRPSHQMDLVVMPKP